MLWYTIKRYLRTLFHVLGVLFFALLCVGAYLWFADPFGVRPMLDGAVSDMATVTATVSEGVGGSVIADKNPKLNVAQERALELVGIDPAKVPTTFTPEQEACFTKTIGTERVKAIKGGDAPSTVEIFKARECVK